jgi:hypothetical protein
MFNADSGMSILRYFGHSCPPGKKRKEMIVDELDASSDSDISPAIDSIDGVCDRVVDFHSESSFYSTSSKSSASRQSTHSIRIGW